MENQRIKPYSPLDLFLPNVFRISKLLLIAETLKPSLNRKSVVKKKSEGGSNMSKREKNDSLSNTVSNKAKIRCIIEITQPDGHITQVSTDAIDALPALATTNLQNRNDLMNFINMTEKGVLEVRNEAGRKIIETYAQEILKKTNQDQTPDDK
jgi:hypothetical protein